MANSKILSLLSGGDRRSIGRADEVVAMVLKSDMLFSELIAGLWSKDPIIRMRSADAAEKVTREMPDLLAPYKKQLLDMLAATQEQELRWHLAAMVPRLALSSRERRFLFAALTGYLQDRSSIVKTSALQGLADLAKADLSLRAKVISTLTKAARNGTPAMKARSRKLLFQLESNPRFPQL